MISAKRIGGLHFSKEVNAKMEQLPAEMGAIRIFS